MELKLEKISLAFDKWKLENFSAKTSSGTITSIVGPSGCGKTTILRIICGLQKADSGKIFFGKKEMTDIPVEKRNAGIVFQNDSLFTHLNVFENIAFGLRMKKEKKISQKVLSALALVHLKGFEKRKVTNLSSGEKKRVAIARALAFKPDLLLLDEPLNGLDAKLKEKTKSFLKEIQKKSGLTMIFVSHDIDEAFFLSEQIIVMNLGKIEQTGTPIEIFSSPKNRFVKNFVSDYALVEAKSKKIGGKSVIEGKFSFQAKTVKGKVFLNFKKSNYKFFEK